MSDNSQTRIFSGVTRAAVSLACGVALIATSTGAAAAPDDYVLIKGFTISEEGLFLNVGEFSRVFSTQQREELIDTVCSRKFIEPIFSSIEAEISMKLQESARLKKELDEEVASGTASMLPSEIMRSEDKSNKINENYTEMKTLQKGLEEFSKKGKKFCDWKNDPIQDFTIIYSSCAFYMQQGGQQILITLPPSTNGAVMFLRAPGEQTMSLNLNHRFQQTANSVGFDTRMLDSSVKLSPTGEQGTHLGLATRLYETQYLATSGAGMLASAGFAENSGFGVMQVESYGEVSIAPDAPGLDVVRAFHRNFANEVRVTGVADAFLNGLVEQMARITEIGMPMFQEQKIGSSVQGRMGNIGQSGYSMQVITGIGVLPHNAAPPIVANICNQTLVAEGESSRDLGQMMAGARAADPGTTGQAQSEIQRAMKEAAKAMESMDPAARKMMEQLGIKIPGMPNSD